jgi:hypothetical protein
MGNALTSCFSTGSTLFDGYCKRCLCGLQLQHLHSTTGRCNSIEQRYVSNLAQQVGLKQVDLVMDRTLHYRFAGCNCPSKRRIDLWAVVGAALIAVEIDESSHMYYKEADEEARYDDLMMHWGGPMSVIRIKPDKYEDQQGAEQDPPLEERLQAATAPILEAVEQARCHSGEAPEILAATGLFYCQKKISQDGKL